MKKSGRFAEYEFIWDKGNTQHLYIDNSPRGLTVELVEACFTDPNLVLGEAQDGANFILAQVEEQIYRVIFEEREGKIRPITVYPARKNHRDLYEQAQRNNL